MIEIPGDILLPPPGEYTGFAVALAVAASGAGPAGPLPARIVVPSRLGEGTQRLEISAPGASPAQLPLRGAEGEVIRARFG